MGAPDPPENKDHHNSAQGCFDHPGLGVPSHKIEHVSSSPFSERAK
jgi:hypothetical protein